VAVERKRDLLSLDVGTLVNTRLSQLDKIKVQIRAQKESDFQTKILNDNLTLEQQKAYREAVLEKEQGRNVPDHDYIRSIRLEISSLNKRVRWRNYQDAFKDSLAEYKAGRATSKKHLNFLQDTLANTADRNIIDDLRTQIIATEDAVRVDYENMVANKIQYARDNGSSAELQKAIDLVDAEIQKAIGIGDFTLTSLYAVKKQNLGMELTVAEIKDEEIDIDIAIAGGADITTKLRWMENKVNTTAQTGTFIVEGVKYDSPRQYWQGRLGSYITDEYFVDKADQLKNRATTWFNKFGDIPMDKLLTLRDEVNQIFGDPVLTPYAETLGINFKQGVLMHALSHKIASLNTRLQVEDSLSQITAISNEVLDLETKIPEISQAANYTTLQQTYASAVRNLLTTKISTFQESKQTEIDTLTDILADTTGMTDEQINAAKVTLARASSDLATFMTSVNLTDIPTSELTFDKSVQSVFDQLISPYAYLRNPISVQGLDIEDWEQEILKGARERAEKGAGVTEKGVEYVAPTPEAEAPPPGPTQPAWTPPKGAIYIDDPKELYKLGGDESKLIREPSGKKRMFLAPGVSEYISDPTSLKGLSEKQILRTEGKIYKLI